MSKIVHSYEFLKNYDIVLKLTFFSKWDSPYITPLIRQLRKKKNWRLWNDSYRSRFVYINTTDHQKLKSLNSLMNTTLILNSRLILFCLSCESTPGMLILPAILVCVASKLNQVSLLYSILSLVVTVYLENLHSFVLYTLLESSLS